MTAARPRPDRQQRLNSLKAVVGQQGGWQAQKSALTRSDTLEAAIRCFQQRGFAGTSTSDIAREAGVSRGAVLHHFPSRLELVVAAADHLMALRMDDFTRRMADLPTGRARTTAGIEAYWQHLKAPEFVALHEILTAARTQPDLAPALGARIHAAEQKWRQEIRQIFPEWLATGPAFDDVLDLTQFLMEGMAAHRWIDGSDERHDRLRRQLTRHLELLLSQAQARRHRAAAE